MPVAAHRAGAARSMSDLQALARLRREAPAAVSTAIAAALLVAAGIAVELEGSVATAPWERLGEVALGLACATCAALGALIVASIPRQRLGLALLLGGFLGALWMLATPLAEGYPDRHGALQQWAAWVENWAFVGLLVLVTWPLLLFPDGHLPSRRWRPVGAVLLVALVAIALHGMLDPATLDSVDAARPVANPLGIPASWTWLGALDAAGVGVPLGVIASMVAVHRRAGRRPDPGMRAALWAARGLAANFVLWAILSTAGAGLADGPLYAVTFTSSIAAFAFAAAFAVLRHRVLEVDTLLRRAFIVVGVTAVTFVAFALVFALVGALAGDGAGAIGGGVAVAMLAVPVGVRVRDRVDRMLYGHRDVSTAMARMSQELDGAGDPADALPGLARAVAETLGASGVLLDPDPRLGLLPVRVGAEPEEPSLERVLRHRGQELGRLVLGARAPGEAFAAEDLLLVELLTRQMTLAVDAVALAAQLQHSRGQIVTAREEERRRLRRDLHDGLGPALAGIALTLQAAQNTGGTEADDLVTGAREQMQDVVAEIRRIVHELRPAVLDDLGLAAAIRVHADRLAPLAIELDLPEPPVPMSAAAELAVYRIATEALTNVVRHAHASTCRVALRSDGDETVLEVTDDGRGLDAGADPGIGLRSMRERAAELGGHVVLSEGSLGGLAVAVRLPHATGELA
ncbi:MAG: sensor histidine kinase [Solirubrobacteraceae bacterium]